MRRNIPWSHRIGETSLSHYGQMMTLIEYRNSNDVDVQFEDGAIVQHKKYNKFKTGYIRNPNLHNDKPEDRIGESIIANCGMRMTIVGYRRANDLDVQFDDGTIITNKAYNAFIKGQIQNPNIMKTKRIGETNTATNGMKMTIIGYRNADDIDVQFEDGVIVEHSSYGCFKKHDVANPNCNGNDFHYYKEGEEHLANCGIKMKIIKYHSNKDIDVKFETGFVRKRTRYYKITHGTVQHDFPYKTKNGINLIRLAYVYNNIGNIEYFCEKCGYHDIDTADVIIKHKCKRSDQKAYEQLDQQNDQ